MKEPLHPPRFDKDSDRLLIAVGEFAILEAHHIVPMEQVRAPVTKTSWDKLLLTWEGRGFGRVITEEDGLGSHTLFALNDAGLREAKRLIARKQREQLGARLRTNFWPAFNGITALIAALAATAAAYSAYEGLHR